MQVLSEELEHFHSGIPIALVVRCKYSERIPWKTNISSVSAAALVEPLHHICWLRAVHINQYILVLVLQKPVHSPARKTGFSSKPDQT